MKTSQRRQQAIIDALRSGLSVEEVATVFQVRKRTVIETVRRMVRRQKTGETEPEEKR